MLVRRYVYICALCCSLAYTINDRQTLCIVALVIDEQQIYYINHLATQSIYICLRLGIIASNKIRALYYTNSEGDTEVASYRETYERSRLFELFDGAGLYSSRGTR